MSRNWPRAARGNKLDERYIVADIVPLTCSVDRRLINSFFSLLLFSVPDGVYLSHPESAATVYDTGLDNSDAIFSEDLETIPITLIPTDVEYNHGKLVAVSKGYISYAAKGAFGKCWHVHSLTIFLLWY